MWPNKDVILYSSTLYRNLFATNYVLQPKTENSNIFSSSKFLSNYSHIYSDPPVQELRSIDANEFATKVTLAWYLLPACYEVTGLKIIFIDGQTRRELDIAADKVLFSYIHAKFLKVIFYVLG